MFGLAVTVRDRQHRGVGEPALTPNDLRRRFDAPSGYLNAASLGLPSSATAEAMIAAVGQWRAGRATAPGYDADVAASREAFAAVAGAPVDRVAIAAQASAPVGLVAAALPDGARVVTVDGDFSSVVFPFLTHAGRGVTVTHVPLDGLAEAITPGTDLVAFSLVQSADGRVADGQAVRAAASAAGALTLCDLTQAAGWMPVHAGSFDVTVTAAYKWLCAPRGTAFMTVSDDALERLRPLYAGWYAGEQVWSSVYGPAMTLAGDARRFDLSPAWLCWVGAATALAEFAAADLAAVRDHDVGLADLALTSLGYPPGGSAIITLEDPDGALLRHCTEAGLSVAARAGRVRAGFHVWNDEEDVERLLAAVRTVRGAERGPHEGPHEGRHEEPDEGRETAAEPPQFTEI